MHATGWIPACAGITARCALANGLLQALPAQFKTLKRPRCSCRFAGAVVA